MLTDTERKELIKERAYHVACISQYRASAAVAANLSRAAKAIDNAQFHERKLEYIESKLALD